LFGLERNWAGNPGLQNLAIPRTLNLLQEAAALATAGGGDDKEDEEEVLGWRGLMYLKRAYYDAYIQVLTHHASIALCVSRLLFTMVIVFLILYRFKNTKALSLIMLFSSLFVTFEFLACFFFFCHF
jgi:hypothetical protein